MSSFLHTFFRQGRVLWGCTLDLLDDEAQHTAMFRAVIGAKCKLMGGVNFKDNIQHNPREIIIRQNMVALWCVRASLLVKPQGELASV